jgi:opacity protein-like surface antigen
MKFVCRFALMAALVASGAARAQAPSVAESDRWSFTVTPYLWAAGIKGDTAANGVGSSIDTGYRFFSLDHLDLALASGFEARKGRWTVLLDGLYVDFKDSFNRALLATDVGVSGGFMEAAAAHRVAGIEGLDVVFGMRYIALRSAVQLTPGPGAVERKSGLDPLGGVRFSHEFNDRWGVTLRGDLGGLGASSKLTTNVSATFGYRLNDTMTLRFGYRALKMDFEDGGFVLDATAQGYVIGLGFAL